MVRKLGLAHRLASAKTSGTGIRGVRAPSHGARVYAGTPLRTYYDPRLISGGILGSSSTTYSCRTTTLREPADCACAAHTQGIRIAREPTCGPRALYEVHILPCLARPGLAPTTTPEETAQQLC